MCRFFGRSAASEAHANVDGGTADQANDAGDADAAEPDLVRGDAAEPDIAGADGPLAELPPDVEPVDAPPQVQPSPPAIRVNAGGGAFTDAAGNQWLADFHYADWRAESLEWLRAK